MVRSSTRRPQEERKEVARYQQNGGKKRMETLCPLACITGESGDFVSTGLYNRGELQEDSAE
jgi:hypothetical protein